MHRDLAAVHVCLVDQRRDLGLGVLLCSGNRPLGEDAASAAILDVIDAVLDVAAYRLADAFGAVRDTLADLVILRREQVVVAVAARDAERGTRGAHPRAVTSPAAIASRSATSVNPGEPTSRTVVTPDNSVRRAFAAPVSA